MAPNFRMQSYSTLTNVLSLFPHPLIHTCPDVRPTNICAAVDPSSIAGTPFGPYIVSVATASCRRGIWSAGLGDLI